MNRTLDMEKTWPAAAAVAPSRLVLTWGAHEVEVTESHPTLTVGRGESSGIVIKDGMVSRRHARIEYRNAHFSLTDLSGNGTYVTDSSGVTHKVINDTYVLAGTGTISFGINPKTGRPHLVKYAVRS